MCRVGKSCLYTPYKTVYLVIPCPNYCICTVYIWLWPTLHMCVDCWLCAEVIAHNSCSYMSVSTAHRSVPVLRFAFINDFYSVVLLVCIVRWRKDAPVTFNIVMLFHVSDGGILDGGILLFLYSCIPDGGIPCF